MTAIAPLLFVRRGAEAIEFYRAAFGAEERSRVTAPSGEIAARLAIGTAEFWVADEAPAYENFSPETLGGCTVRMILTVDDPNAWCARAIAAGAREVWPVAEQYGWLLGRVADPFGHHWEIGYPLPHGH